MKKSLAQKKTINKTSIGSYLIKRLEDYGVRHVFGIPGDYVLDFYDMINNSPITMVGTVKEDGAGFAADAYARLNGIGACCVTYCVGGLSIVNAIAGAYAEKSPVVVLAGSPALQNRFNEPMLHHKVKSFSTQKEIFEKITETAIVIEKELTAFQQIDDTLETCWRSKRPVYIELPADMVNVVPQYPYSCDIANQTSNKAALEEALNEVIEKIKKSKQPVILAGVEIHRYGLAQELAKLINKTGIPVAVTLLGKSVVSEKQDSFIGVYEGAMGRAETQQYVEYSDCLIMLGTFLTDVNLGIFTAKLDRLHTIEATSEKIQISHHSFHGILFEDFIKALLDYQWTKRTFNLDQFKTQPLQTIQHAEYEKNKPIKVSRFFQCLNDLLEDNMIVICDVGLCLFGAIDLTMHKCTEFLAPAYYTSMGYAIPASLGANLANKNLRPIVLVGDGAFQMTGMELASIGRQNLAPIVIILNNKGYTTERFIKQGDYNDLPEWKYDKIPEIIGKGWGKKVKTENEFIFAWEAACANARSFSILNLELDPMDSCPALERLAKKLADMSHS